MSTTEDVEFDHETYMNEISLDSVQIHYGKEAREKRREIAIRALTCFNRGSDYQIAGAYDRAIEDLNKAIDLKPNYVQAYFNRGSAYRGKGAYDRAIADYSKVIKLNPDYALAYFNRGSTYRDKGIYDCAIADYSTAIDLNPDYALAYFNRGLCWQILQNWRSARSDLTFARQMGMNIIVAFRKNYENVVAFERRHGVQLPKDIASMLTP